MESVKITKQERFMRAIEANDFKTIKRLFKHVDPSAEEHWPIRHAAGLGHTAFVRLLLTDDRVYPNVANNGPIKDAFKNGHWDVVYLLIKNKRVREHFLHVCEDLTKDEIDFLLYFDSPLDDIKETLRLRKHYIDIEKTLRINREKTKRKEREMNLKRQWF